MSAKTGRQSNGDSPADEALRKATERAELAEAEVERLRAQVGSSAREDTPAEPSAIGKGRVESEDDGGKGAGEGMLRRDTMMAHLLDSLQQGRDIGHYGRLVFAMVARHFLSEDEVVNWLRRDSDFSEEQARVLLRQVEGRDYNPPKRERIVEWQRQQDFPILPNADDPDCGNLYRNLKFPDSVYEHIEDYQEQKATAE